MYLKNTAYKNVRSQLQRSDVFRYCIRSELELLYGERDLIAIAKFILLFLFLLIIIVEKEEKIISSAFIRSDLDLNFEI